MRKSMNPALALGMALFLGLGVAGCASASPGEEGTRSSQNRITQEEIAATGVSTLYEVVQRLRPRWLEVRAQRTFDMETQVLVFMNRTLVGGVEELRRIGVEAAHTLEYFTGAQAAGEFTLPRDRLVEGVIVIRTSDGD
jgi:hypothetical protein